MQRLFLFFLLFVLLYQNSSTTFTDVTTQVGLAGLHGNVAAFGDFNSDKETDVFVIVDSTEGQGQCVEIFLWDASHQKFRKSRAKVCPDKYRLLKDSTIVNVAPGDFDGDGCMDIVITSQKLLYTNQQGPRSMHVFWGDRNSDDLDRFETLNGTSGGDGIKDQPLVMDVNGDMLPDLFAAKFSNPSERLYWISSKGKSFEVVQQRSNTSITDGRHRQSRVHPSAIGIPLLPLALPHSSAFLDLTGDMTADLLVTSVNSSDSWVFEIWENKDGVLQLSSSPRVLSRQQIDKVSHVGQSAFVDIDADGDIDHLVPLCTDASCEGSHIYLYTKDKWLKLLSNEGTIKWRFILQNGSSFDQPMMTIRTGDYNMDGYPDALVVAHLKQRSGPEETVALLLENVPCSEHGNCALGRTFKVHWKVLESIKGAVTATFFDLYENGNTDFLVVSKNQDGEFHLHAIRNDLFTDTNFLKIMVLSGICFPSCPCREMPYGVNTPGPFIKYTTTDTDGKPKYGSAAQLSQSSHFALQLPFTTFGLGRTPNFVDKLQVGMPRAYNSPIRTRSWPSIIPNSQVIVIPHPLNEPQWWTIRLLVTPSKLVLLTGISLLGICVFISFIILCLHFREKRADEKEKREEAHKFHFDAM